MRPNENNVCGNSYSLLNVKLLNQCNGKCAFCIANGTKDYSTCSLEDKVKSTIVSLKKFKNCDVLGGESTLYPYFVEFVKQIRPYVRGNLGVISNGSNIDKLLSTVDYFDTITLSIHNYDLSKNFTKIDIDLDKLDQLNKAAFHTKAETVCAFMVIKSGISTFDEIKKMAEFAKKHYFKAIKLMELSTENLSTDEYIDLQQLLKPYGIHQEVASIGGCFFELPKLSEKLGIKTYVKITCAFNNCFKAKRFGIPELEYQKNYMNVVQPNGEVTDTWMYVKKGNEITGALK